MGIFLESCSTELLLAGAALLYAVYYYMTLNFSYWKDMGVAYISPIPVFGNVMQMMIGRRSPAETFMDMYHAKEFEGERFAGAWLSRNPVLLAHDPDFIKDVLIKDFQYFSDRGLQFNEKREPLQAHLFNLGGWRWRVLRTKLTPTFTSGKMKLMYSTMAECAQGLEKLLDAPASKGEIIEIKEPLAKFTTDIIGTCAFGLKFNSMTDGDSEFRKMGRAIFEPSLSGLIKRAILQSFPWITKYFNVSIINPKISKFFLSAVEETVQYREENNVSRNDMMQLMIDIKKQGAIVDEEEKYDTTAFNIPKDEQGRQVLELDNKLLAAQAFVFFLAGFETSSTTMSFALYELARNPDVQEKLAEDIAQTIKKHDGQLTYECVQDMKYLDMVISETLRRYPPVPNLFRKVTKPYKISDSDVLLPKGMRVFIPVYAIQNDPKYFPNPDKFEPERFSPEHKHERHSMVYLPFGEGPRNCIGMRFGLLQSKIGLATVIGKFKFEVCEETPIPPKFDPRAFVTTLEKGVHLKISKRT